MAQQATRTIGTTDETDPETVPVTVGERTFQPTERELPERIGQFEHHVASNPQTAMWARRWHKSKGEYAHVKETYAVTCEHGSGWEVSRGVVLRERGEIPNAIVEEVVTAESVRTGFETFAAAMEQAERIMHAASRRTVEQPGDLSERQAAAIEPEHTE